MAKRKRTKEQTTIYKTNVYHISSILPFFKYNYWSNAMSVKTDIKSRRFHYYQREKNLNRYINLVHAKVTNV